MKHVGDVALGVLEDLLARIRTIEGLTEKKRGTFYRKSAAFIHFQEDPAGLFADLHLKAGWKRLPVNTQAERKAFLAALTTDVY